MRRFLRPPRVVRGLLALRRSVIGDAVSPSLVRSNRDHRKRRLAEPTIAPRSAGGSASSEFTVDLPTALFRDLLYLSSSVGLDDDALTAPLVALVADLQAAVPSYRGLHPTLVEDGHPVSLAAFLHSEEGESITTSLRLPFTALGPLPRSGVCKVAAITGTVERRTGSGVANRFQQVGVLLKSGTIATLWPVQFPNLRPYRGPSSNAE